LFEATTKPAKRVRRVRVILALTYETAWTSFGDAHADVSNGLKAVFYNVLPPAVSSSSGPCSLTGYQPAHRHQVAHTGRRGGVEARHVVQPCDRSLSVAAQALCDFVVKRRPMTDV
jgi:hypothetical protein